MQSLITKLKQLQNSSINKTIEQRLKQFSQFKSLPEEKWFSELCFCILAANSKQKTAEAIEKSLGFNKLLTLPHDNLAKFIRDNKHRFHNNKASYIIEARKFSNIKFLIKDLNEQQSRDFLVNNIKGLGFKEASHFLRNTGSQNLAILDRHILRTLEEHKIINEIPKSLTKNNYLLIESEFIKIAKKLNLSPAKLDLMMWYLKTGEVAK